MVAASVGAASVHSTLSIRCHRVALRHVLANAHETGRPPPPPPPPPGTEPPGNGCYRPPPPPHYFLTKACLGSPSVSGLTAEGRQLDRLSPPRRSHNMWWVNIRSEFTLEDAGASRRDRVAELTFSQVQTSTFTSGNMNHLRQRPEPGEDYLDLIQLVNKD